MPHPSALVHALAFTATLGAAAAAHANRLVNGSFEGGFNYVGLDNVDVELVSVPGVPEPETWALLLGGIGALAARAARGRRQVAPAAPAARA